MTFAVFVLSFSLPFFWGLTYSLYRTRRHAWLFASNFLLAVLCAGFFGLAGFVVFASNSVEGKMGLVLFLIVGAMGAVSGMVLGRMMAGRGV
jgi:hypothetical protein